jgi:carbonic anhydrase/acetyltransferase-like protein (isoleucine patch superfamily)
MSATIMDYAAIKSYSMVAAGALVSPKKIVEENELWAGVPAKFMRILTEAEKNYISISKDRYVNLGQEHKNLALNPKP